MVRTTQFPTATGSTTLSTPSAAFLSRSTAFISLRSSTGGASAKPKRSSRVAIRAASCDGSSPVSYTHLDVYKRQGTDRNLRNPESDLEFETRIRPQGLEHFAGQDKIVENLRIFIRAALMRGDSLDHVLLHGPPGPVSYTHLDVYKRQAFSSTTVPGGTMFPIARPV